MSRTILVTGGLGFIGSHFVRFLLRESHDVRVVNLDKLTYAGCRINVSDLASDPRYSWVQGDIADPTIVDRVFRQEHPELVVNLAAESHVDRSILDAGAFVRTNVEGVHVLLEAAKRYRVERFLQVSTDEVYGDIPNGDPPADEGAPLHPSSPYSATKAAGDHLCLAYARTHGLPTLIVRPSNNYGPNQFPEKLIPVMIAAGAAGEPLPIYGDGRQQRDWIFVEDSVRALSLVLERGEPGRVYNVSTGHERANVEVARAICDVVADELETDPGTLHSLIRFIPDRPGHDRRYATVAKRLTRELSWRAAVEFADGLRRTVRWYLSNRSWVTQVLSEEYRRYRRDVYERRWRTA